MCANIREFTGIAKKLGMTRNPDAAELRIRLLQQQQLQQHSQSTKLLSEIRADQVRILEQSHVVQAGDPSQNQKPYETTTSEGDGALLLANNLAKEFSSLRTEVDELSKVVRQLVDKKPEEYVGIANLQTMLVTQDPKMNKMAEMGQEASWTDVVRRKKKKNAAEAIPTPGTVTNPPLVARKQRVRTRPPAIMIDVASCNDFPALAKRIKDGMDGKTIGNGKTSMKKAKNGGILMEVRGDEAAVEAIRSEVAKSAAQDVSVRLLGQKTMLEIRDIDAWTGMRISLTVLQERLQLQRRTLTWST